jgi:hypothetical protein
MKRKKEKVFATEIEGEGETSCHDTCFDFAQGSFQMAYQFEFKQKSKLVETTLLLMYPTSSDNIVSTNLDFCLNSDW